MLSPNEREDFLGDPVHLLALRAALDQQEIDADPLELPNALGDLLRCPDKTRPQTAVRDAVVLKRNLGLKLRALDEVQVARIPSRARAYIRDAGDLLLHLGVSLTDDRVSGDPEAERRQLGMLLTPRAHVGDLRGKHLRRVAVHEIRVALTRGEILRRG